MGPINTLPLGFLDMLGLQQSGRNLQTVADALAATIDATPFYAAYKRTFAINDANFAASAANSVVIGIVPQGEYWYFICGLVSNASGAGGTGQAYIEVTQEGRSVFCSEPLSMTFANLNLAKPVTLQTSIPLILPPGSQIQKFGFGLAGAGAERMNARISYLALHG